MEGSSCGLCIICDDQRQIISCWLGGNRIIEFTLPVSLQISDCDLLKGQIHTDKGLKVINIVIGTGLFVNTTHKAIAEKKTKKTSCMTWLSEGSFQCFNTELTSEDNFVFLGHFQPRCRQTNQTHQLKTGRKYRKNLKRIGGAGGEFGRRQSGEGN